MFYSNIPARIVLTSTRTYFASPTCEGTPQRTAARNPFTSPRLAVLPCTTSQLESCSISLLLTLFSSNPSSPSSFVMLATKWPAGDGWQGEGLLTITNADFF